MTREEAISIMNVIIHMLEPQYDNDRVEEAVDMAIESLELEPCEELFDDWHEAPSYAMTLEQAREAVHELRKENVKLRKEPCKDTISREAVLKEIPALWNSNGGKDYCMETLRDFITELPSVTPTRNEWIPVSERLPKCEQKVLVLVLSHNNTYTITTGMYEDGSMSECDSVWNWEDVEFEKWDDENDCGIVPEGWYEYHEFNPDGVLNYAIYGKVVAWMPLPEGGENK